MKAWVLHGVDDLRFEDREMPKPEVVFECVGKPETAALAIEAAASGDRVVMVGRNIIGRSCAAN